MSNPGLILDAKSKKKKESILSAISEIEESEPILLSSMTKQEESKKEKKKNKKRVIIEDDGESSTDDWVNRINSFSDVGKKKKKKQNKFKGFELDGDMIAKEIKKKKKGKKGKKAGELTDYNTQFAPELSLLRIMQKDQTSFVNSLQKKYDDMEKSKSSVRGIGKFTTDLIQQINMARSTQLSVIDKMVSVKSKIADLTIKEKKEFGAKKDGDGENINDISSKYLQQLLGAGRSAINNIGYNDKDVYEASYEELESALSEGLGDTDRDPAVEKFLEYENDNVEVVVLYNVESGEWEYAAFKENGERIYDYKEGLPSKNIKLTLNLSTGLASDEYSRKYRIIKVGGKDDE